LLDALPFDDAHKIIFISATSASLDEMAIQRVKIRKNPAIEGVLN